MNVDCLVQNDEIILRHHHLITNQNHDDEAECVMGESVRQRERREREREEEEEEEEEEDVSNKTGAASRKLHLRKQTSFLSVHFLFLTCV